LPFVASTIEDSATALPFASCWEPFVVNQEIKNVIAVVQAVAKYRDAIKTPTEKDKIKLLHQMKLVTAVPLYVAGMLRPFCG
jgi:hypothetical protein